MAIAKLKFTRTNEPDFDALRVAVAPLLAVSNAGGFHLAYEAQGQKVVIEYGDFTGVDTASVQTQVTNAPARTARTDAKVAVDTMSVFEKAALLTMLDQVNVCRANLPTPLAAITPAQYLNLVKAKADTL